MGQLNIDDQLSELLHRVGEAYDQSAIKKWCGDHGQQWAYSLITGACKIEAPLFVGFNWGAAQNISYDPQVKIEHLALTNQDLGSLKRIIPYLQKHMLDGSIEYASQSNFCFFRSHTENQISENDLLLCQDIFMRLIEVMSPSIILSFSSRLRNFMVTQNLVRQQKSQSFKFMRGGREISYQATHGVLCSGTKITFLPHPNYPMTRSARDGSWAFCFED